VYDVSDPNSFVCGRVACVCVLQWLPFISKESIFVILNGKEGRACLTRDPAHKKVNGHEFGIVIVSYDLVSKLVDEIKQYKFGVIIADESHNLKSAKAQRTKVIVPMLKKATRAILLSGTRTEQPHVETTCVRSHARSIAANANVSDRCG
jgi:hypothetical protein